MLNQFSNLSCYEEFEIQSALMGISKTDILKEIGHKIDDYYFFISNDGIFNWYDSEGNHVEDPGVLKKLHKAYIPKNIINCIVPNSVTNIGDNAFSNCKSLTSITIPTSVTSISHWAFELCESLKEIVIPNSVINIGHGAFYRCDSLISIIIPDSVISICDWVFISCESLKEVIFKGKTLEEVKQMENYPFGIEAESIIKCKM